MTCRLIAISHFSFLFFSHSHLSNLGLYRISLSFLPPYNGEGSGVEDIGGRGDGNKESVGVRVRGGWGGSEGRMWDGRLFRGHARPTLRLC